MTEHGTDPLLFDPPEQENIRLREENSRLPRLLSTHGIAIPQWTPASPSSINATESMKVDREERQKANRTIPKPFPREGGCLRTPAGVRGRSLRLRDFNRLRALRGGFSEGCQNNAAKIYAWL
jgi:hypothetical protein